jgi:hypothetical protein
MMTLTGVSEMVQKIISISNRFPDEVLKALYQESQIEVVEMKKRCPVDVSPNPPHPGNLRASIHAEQPERQGRRLIQIFATGKQAPYAIYVHEIPPNEAVHPVGEWKFMESVLRESRPYMGERLASRLQFNRMQVP